MFYLTKVTMAHHTSVKEYLFKPQIGNELGKTTPKLYTN